MNFGIEQPTSFDTIPFTQLKHDIHAFSPDFYHGHAYSPTNSVASSSPSTSSFDPRKISSLDESVLAAEQMNAYYDYTTTKLQPSIKADTSHLHIHPHHEVLINDSYLNKRVESLPIKQGLLSPLPDSFYDNYPEQHPAAPNNLEMFFPTPPLRDLCSIKTNDLENTCVSSKHSSYRQCYQANHVWPNYPLSRTLLCVSNCCFSPQDLPDTSILDPFSVNYREACAFNCIPTMNSTLNEPNLFEYPMAHTCPMANTMYPSRDKSYTLPENREVYDHCLDTSFSNACASKVDYYRHEEPVAVIPSHTRQTTNITATRRYQCYLCDKRFTRPSSLATHIHSHTGEVGIREPHVYLFIFILNALHL
ncbi:hypothetical protein BDF14DRAFT_1753191 [Spinellus fusiger]|nr:hypothetical protein BDF14DRAFT_1753191 [Spinellus fusiger]